MKTLYKLGLLGILLCLGQLALAQGQFGSIKGTLLAKDSTGVINGYAWIEQSGGINKAITDLDGKFEISAVEPGDYTVFFTYQGDSAKRQVKVKPSQTKMMGKIVLDGKILDVIDVVGNKHEFIEPGEELKITMDMEELEQNANLRDISKLVGSMSSDIKVAPDGELYFRGARKGDMLYLLDGVKQNEFNSVPGVALKSVTVYTGGLPAKYGDTTGGVVVMETKSYFDLYRAWKIAEHRRKQKEKLQNL